VHSILNKTLKRFLVPVLASGPVAAIANRVIGAGVPIFMLHRITQDADLHSGAITSEHLRRCLDYLLTRNYAIIPLEKLISALVNNEKLQHRTVVFTMDDGFLDQAEVAAPIFLEFDCPLTFFVITGMLDQTLWPWDAQISWITETTREPALKTVIHENNMVVRLDGMGGRRRAKRILQDILRETPAAHVPETLQRLATAARIVIPRQPPGAYRPMDWDKARELEAKGIRFGPHSVSHHVMSSLDDVTLQREITESWKSLQQELENPLKVFCYPIGHRRDYGKREIDLLKREGFLGAVSTISELIDPANHTAGHVFNLPRLALPDNMENFIQCCTWIEYARQKRQNGGLQK
jgi:peptidoglycan/xylan/chitin deacetylase (PgdA/CDA1 family)